MSKVIYLIRKIGIELSLPIGLTFILLLLGLLKNKKKLTLTAILIFYFGSINIVSQILIRYIEYPWKYIDISSVRLHNSIVVLSGGIIHNLSTNNNYEWNDPDRFFGGIKLFKNNKAKKLVFTGGMDPFNQTTKSEGYLLKIASDSFLEGIENIIVTDNANNTFQEVLQVKKLISNSEILNDIILVTSAYHMNRALLLFEKEGIKATPFPVDFRSNNSKFSQIVLNPLNWLPNAESFKTTNFVIKEIYGRLVYKLF